MSDETLVAIDKRLDKKIQEATDLLSNIFDKYTLIDKEELAKLKRENVELAGQVAELSKWKNL